MAYRVCTSSNCPCVEQLPAHTPTETLVAEDKDRAPAWLCDRWSSQWRRLQCIPGDGTWERTGVTTADAAQARYAIFEPLHRRKQWPPAGPNRWETEFGPFTVTP